MSVKSKRSYQKEINIYMFFKFNNVTIADVCTRFKTNRSYVVKILSLFTSKDKSIKPVHLGSKNQPYFSEEEMLNGFTNKYTAEEIESEWGFNN